VSLLDYIEEAMKKAWENGFILIKIEIKSETHKELKDELETRRLASNNKTQLKTVFGVPVVIDDTIPADRLWIAKMGEVNVNGRTTKKNKRNVL